MNYDKLGKVHWLIDYLSEAFMKYNNSQPEQSIDEGSVFIILYYYLLLFIIHHINLKCLK